MVSTPGKIPEFQQPTETSSPVVASLLTDRLYVEDGIEYSQYKPLRALDPLELKKSSKYGTYYFSDANCFVDSSRILLDLTWYCTKGDNDDPLTTDDMVSTLNPPSQVHHGQTM